MSGKYFPQICWTIYLGKPKSSNYFVNIIFSFASEKTVLNCELSFPLHLPLNFEIPAVFACLLEGKNRGNFKILWETRLNNSMNQENRIFTFTQFTQFTQLAPLCFRRLIATQLKASKKSHLLNHYSNITAFHTNWLTVHKNP